MFLTAGPPGRAMLAVVPVVAIVDVLERLILCALNCQVVDDNNNNEDEYSSMSNSIGGLKSNALRSFVPRLYAAFGRIFPALVDGTCFKTLKFFLKNVVNIVLSI